MKISLVICTRNRADQLEICLDKINKTTISDADLEIIIVNNASVDHTQIVIQNFISSTKLVTKTLVAERPGLGYARNCGLSVSTGDLIVFTDDDCYLEEDYFKNLLNNFNPEICQYGMGQILLYDPEDDARVANAKIEKISMIPPKTAVVPAGTIQGANMFFLRKVFDVAGNFNENMGAGTTFPCEDIEMAARASHYGFTGGCLPGFTVYHHHGRKKDSPEADKVVASYDYGRGAYYASLLSMGVFSAWDFWGQTLLENGELRNKIKLDRLSRELIGASQYIDFLLKDEKFQISKSSNANRLKIHLKNILRRLLRYLDQ
ncbi:MAG: glycosyltransferase family 2 protein [Methyloglobulus sp.]|nr:glycosyltransferase family 2 protein [Methyloglobulus sp.]